MRILFCYLIIFFLTQSYGQTIDSIVFEVILKAENLRKEEEDFIGAINLLNEKLFALENVVEDKLKIAPLYHKIGVNYYYLGDMENALKYNSRSLIIREEILGSNHLDVIRGYYNRASILRMMQDFNKAKNDISHAVSKLEYLINFQDVKEVDRLMKMYREMFVICLSLNDNKKALEYWDLIYEFCLRNEPQNNLKIASLLNERGIILFNEGEYIESKNCYLDAIQQINLNNSNNQEKNLGTIVHNLANVESTLKEYYKSKEHYKEAIQVFLYNKQNDQNNFDILQRLGNTYADLINLCSKTQEWEEGKGYFDLALQYTTEGWGTYYHPRVAELYRNRAKLSIGQGMYEEALYYNQKSLQALLPDFKTDDPFIDVNLNNHGIKNKNSFLETIKQKAEIYSKSYRQDKNKSINSLQAAFRNYITLDTVITQIRQSYESQGSQFDLIKQTYPIYENAIGIAIELFEVSGENYFLEMAFHFASKNKAMVLLAGMQDEQAKAYSSIADDLKEKEKKLKRSIFQLESKIYDQAGKSPDPGLKDSLFTLKREYQKLIDRFELESPDYFDLKYRFDKTSSAADLQKQIPIESAIIEFFVGDRSIFIFTLTRNSFDYVQLSKPDDFEISIEKLRDASEKPGDLQLFIERSSQLYDWLLKDVIEKVEGNSKISNLIFIPDGPLLQISFDVLVVKNQNNQPKYLLQKYPISYAYSSRLLFDGDSRKRKPSQNFAGFGLEYDDYTLADLATYVDNPLSNLPLSRALGPLVFSDDEIREISELLGGQAWINQEATRQAFLDNAPNYAILHLATHGVLNERYPMNSALIFTRQNDSTDYFLRAADLYGMELQAEMAVLSACNTGNGIVERGEGVRSLARAFAAAGCPSLVASLWNASDASTKEILVSFYQNLEKGMTKSEAMQQAKLTYLESAPPAYRAPYYWSHLSVIGESGQLEVLKKAWWQRYWYLWATGLGIAGALAASRWKAAA